VRCLFGLQTGIEPASLAWKAMLYQ